MKKILIVDDAVFMRDSIKRILEKNNYNIVGEAENGQIAIEKYKELCPDIVTMDIAMPIMDGLTSLQKILSINPSANIIMISSMDQKFLIREAILSGAKGYIIKPFREDEILTVLKKLV